MADERAVTVLDGGRALDARFFVEAQGGALTLVFESRGGGRGTKNATNLEYAPGMALLLSRLGERGAVLTDLRVESLKTQREALSPEECRVDIRDRDYPLALAGVDPERLRRDITYALRAAGRAKDDPPKRRGSGAWKRVRFYLSVPGFDPEAAHGALLQRQLRRGRPQGPTPFDVEPVDDTLTEDTIAQALQVPDGATDGEATVKRRREQRYIRQRLLRGRAAASCALCGRTFPPGFLVAAHIKRRADCSEAERKDVEHVAMLACRFGCDALYEAGFIYVDAGGVVRAGQGVERVDGELARCEGRRCLAHSGGSAGYFAWHRAHIAGVKG